MGPWGRTLAIGAAAVAGALLLKLVPPLLVLALFVGGGAYAYSRIRRSKEAERPSGAQLLGLKRESTDPFGILGYPLALLARTTKPAIDELAWGRWRSLDVHAFVLSFEPPPVPGHAAERASFACAMTRLQTSLPGLVVEPETFRMQLVGAPPSSEVEFGDATFDAATNVWSDDEAFARRVLDPPTRAWLRTLELEWGFEVRDRIALVYGPKPERPDLVRTLEILRELLERLPDDLGAPRPPVG